MESFDVIVVGGGQAGLGTSYFLKKFGINHIIFERGRVAETWRSQRWDSFAVNTPNKYNHLPGDPYQGNKPDSFYLRDELISYFQNYSDKFNLPIRTGVTVTNVYKERDIFVVEAKNQGGESLRTEAANLVVASGIMQTANYPKLKKLLPKNIKQYHSSTYRNPSSLPKGAVVVVGGGQSGVQIAEELVNSGKEVFLASSKVGRLPRRYRGKEIMFWWEEIGYWDEVEEDDRGKPLEITTGALPNISGVGPMGHTISYQALAKMGVKILGRLIGVEDEILIFDEKAKEYIQFGDEASKQYKKAIDDYLEKNNIDAPPVDSDPADLPDYEGESAANISRLNINDADVRSIIWATGFKPNFYWLDLPVFDKDGKPIHENGIAKLKGLYFIGFPWISKRRSGIIGGIEEDALRIVKNINQNVSN